jgi:hypothetical protein
MRMGEISDRNSTPQNGEEEKEAVDEATHQSRSLKSSTSKPNCRGEQSREERREEKRQIREEEREERGAGTYLNHDLSVSQDHFANATNELGEMNKSTTVWIPQRIFHELHHFHEIHGCGDGGKGKEEVSTFILELVDVRVGLADD